MDTAAEIFDQLQWLYDTNGFNDHQLHCVLEFERPLDTEILKRAVVASIQAIPILGARYIDGAIARWTSLDPIYFERAFVIAPTQAEFEAFVVAKVDEGTGPQIRVCVLNSDGYAVAFKLNHMICDAAGFKQYLEFLAMIYSRLTTDAHYTPPTIAGDRSFDPILRAFGLGVQLKALFKQRGDSRWTETQKFPLSDDGEAQPFIVSHKLDRAKVGALKGYCRANSVTVNDALLTAMYRVLFRTLTLKSGEPLQIPIMVDMRRYVSGKPEFDSLTNLTSMVSTQLDYRSGESFGDTLARARAVMLDKKSGAIGLNGWVKLKLIYRALGNATARKLLRSRLKQPFICMTNIGTLEPVRMSFAGALPKDAYLCGSIKYRPYFQLAVSTYDGEITLSVNQYGDEADRERVVAFLDEVGAELSGVGD
jgi:NRPS condensation-like uncharacterized protein